SKRYNPLYGTKQIQQSSYVIGSHVKDRPGALSIEELRTRLPAFRTTAHEKCRTPNRPPDCAIIHQFPGCLMPPSKKSVGSASNAKSLRSRRFKQRPRLLARQSYRFL